MKDSALEALGAAVGIFLLLVVFSAMVTVAWVTGNTLIDVFVPESHWWVKFSVFLAGCAAVSKLFAPKQ